MNKTSCYNFYYRHSIESGRWSNNRLSSDGSSSRLTIQEAVSEWYNSDTSMRYTDICQGPFCNEECPDEFVLFSITSNNWPEWVKFLVITVIILIPIACIIFKGLFVAWLFVLERKQLAYLDSFYDTESGINKLQVNIITFFLVSLNMNYSSYSIVLLSAYIIVFFMMCI